MKQFWIELGTAFMVITALCALEFTGVLPPIGNYGTEYPGDSGVTMPGSGAELAEISSTEITQTQTPQTQTKAEPAAAETQVPPEPPKESAKENEPMNDMLLVFWHGVAAVLIGESAALIIAITCLRAVIRKKIKEREETK